jgi:predicted Zn-dependent protease
VIFKKSVNFLVIMRKTLSLFLITGLVIIACQRVPLTGRKQLIMVTSAEILPLSANQYSETLSKSQVVRSGRDYQMIVRVGNRLRVAVENYLNSNNYGARIRGYQWEFNLIQSDVPNAWCMAGGKVAFYTGILPYTQNEMGVATVMGHEIAHAIAAHNEERMSESLLANGLMQSGALLINDLSPPKKREANMLLLQAAGVAYQYGRALPHSRAQESEADRLGLIFMALAGYDPHEAPVFWERFSRAGSGQKSPEFLSTHPSGERRIRDLRAQMPQAMAYYRPSTSTPVTPEVIDESDYVGLDAADTLNTVYEDIEKKPIYRSRAQLKRSPNSAKSHSGKSLPQKIVKKKKKK